MTAFYYLLLYKTVNFIKIFLSFFPPSSPWIFISWHQEFNSFFIYIKESFEDKKILIWRTLLDTFLWNLKKKVNPKFINPIFIIYKKKICFFLVKFSFTFSVKIFLDFFSQKFPLLFQSKYSFTFSVKNLFYFFSRKFSFTFSVKIRWLFGEKSKNVNFSVSIELYVKSLKFCFFALGWRL